MVPGRAVVKMTPRAVGNKIGHKLTRADCMVETAAEGQYPVGKHRDRAGHVVYTPGISPGSKVYFTIEGGRKVIHFVDQGRP